MNYGYRFVASLLKRLIMIFTASICMTVSSAPIVVQPGGAVAYKYLAAPVAPPSAPQPEPGVGCPATTISEYEPSFDATCTFDLPAANHLDHFLATDPELYYGETHGRYRYQCIDGSYVNSPDGNDFCKMDLN